VPGERNLKGNNDPVYPTMVKEVPIGALLVTNAVKSNCKIDAAP
jgi:hypothetical protein